MTNKLSDETTYLRTLILFFQLILEKQKLIAMQLHLHLSEHKYTDVVRCF